MRLTADQTLRGIRDNLLTIVLPEIDNAYVRGQVQSMTMQLGLIASQWDGEGGRQGAANEAMKNLVSRCAAVLSAHHEGGQGDDWARIGIDAAAVAGAQWTDDGTLTNLFARQDQLSAALARILVAFEQIAARQPRPAVLALRREAYAFLRDQLSAG
jgi:hypothetical protein